MTDTLWTLVTYSSYVLSGIIVALTAIAPLTKTAWDNKVLSALVWVHDHVLTLILPLHDVSAKTADAPVDAPKA